MARRCHRIPVFLFFSLFVFVSVSTNDTQVFAQKKKPVKITYEEHVKPIFRQRCFACHNGNKKKGSVDLTNYTNLMLGGSSGEVIERGSSGDSYLYMLVTHESEPYMPAKAAKIPNTELEIIRKWIDGGALENKGSKAVAAKKKFDLTLQSAPSGRPAGPPLMPGILSRQPLFRTAKTTALTAIASSPWAPLVAVAGQKQIFLYNSRTLEILGILPFPEGTTNVLKFSRNGSLLLAGGGRGAAKGVVVVWNIRTGERVIEVGDEFDTVLAADISSDQTMIALGGPGRVVRIYDTATGKLMHEIKKHTDWITALEFSPDSVLLATADRNGGMFVWEAFTAREYLSLKGHRATVTDVSWRIDSNVLASCSEDTTIKLWEMNNGGQIRNWGAHGGGVESIEFTRDGRIASCGRDRVAKIWDQNGKLKRSFSAFKDLALRVTHCDESNYIIAGDWTGEIRVWNVADGKQVGTLSSNPIKLETRLASVQQAVAPQDANYKKLLAQAQQSKKTLDQTAVNLANAKKTLTEAQKQVATSADAIKKSQQLLAQYQKQKLGADTIVKKLSAFLPALTISVAKGEEAVKKSGNDKTLAGIVARLKALQVQKQAELQKSTKTATDTAAVIKKEQATLAASQAVSKKSQAQIKASQAQIKALQPKIKPMTVQFQAMSKSSAAAAQTLATTKKTVKKWQVSLEMEKQFTVLAGLKNQLKESQTKQAEFDAEWKKQQAEQNKFTLIYTKANQALVANQAKVNQLKQTLAATQKKHQGFIQQTAALTAAIPLLKDSLKKTQEAQKSSGNDKEIVALVTQLTGVVAAKEKILTATQQAAQLAQKDAAKIQQDLAAAEKIAAAASKTATDTKKNADAFAPKVIAAKQSFDATVKAVAEVQKKIAATRLQLEKMAKSVL